jgi:REP element-mobilizing transposase RayT
MERQNRSKTSVARKLRVQYEGALYHVVNRGNYRRDVFGTVGAAQAFVRAVEEAAQSYGWLVHAYVVMRNHYHIVLETPQPNLVEGMHWLQSAFATRFNRIRSERGHLFQGRYHAGLIEDYRTLGHVVDYVHLNPVRAGIVAVDQAASFRWSSLGRFVRGERLPWLVANKWLECFHLADNPEGWRAYQAHMVELSSNLAEQKRLGWKEFSYGWALGSESWRMAVSATHKDHALHPGIEGSAARDLHEAHWTEKLQQALEREGRTEAELLSARKGEPWKVGLAQRMRLDCGASCIWLSEKLHLGTPSSARSLLCRARNSKNQ